MEIGDEAPTTLYRLYDAADALLYVGITGNLEVRFATHASLKPWWPEVGRRTVELYATRTSAAEAELEAIGLERPLHNVQGQASGLFGIDPGDLPDGADGQTILGLVMLDMPPTSLRLALLELIGIPTPAALDMLGVDRTSRYRVINRR